MRQTYKSGEVYAVVHCDRVGRISFNKTLCRALDIKVGSLMGVSLSGDELIVRPLDDGDVTIGAEVAAYIRRERRLSIPIAFRRILGFNSGTHLVLLKGAQPRQLRVRVYYPSTQIGPHLDAIRTINRMDYDCGYTRNTAISIEEHLQNIEQLLRELEEGIAGTATINL